MKVAAKPCCTAHQWLISSVMELSQDLSTELGNSFKDGITIATTHPGAGLKYTLVDSP
jgi:hypothetical protein